jgi:hypothetical protein
MRAVICPSDRNLAPNVLPELMVLRENNPSQLVHRYKRMGPGSMMNPYQHMDRKYMKAHSLSLWAVFEYSAIKDI